MKKSSWFVLGAALNIFINSLVLSVKAANLDADMGQDFEARIAELEAMPEHIHYNIILLISGQVDRALFAWEDTVQSKHYMFDTTLAPGRFRLKGTPEIAAQDKAGFYMEYKPYYLNRGKVTANRDDFVFRQGIAFVESATLGRVSIAQWSVSDSRVSTESMPNMSSLAQCYCTQHGYIIPVPCSTGTHSIGKPWPVCLY